MPRTILGLDIGGANLKAATPDKRAISVPFALWKQPDKLPAALAELIAKFPDAEELAVTMTGELCDCYETKREGVNAIIEAVRFASSGKRIRAWSTDGTFVDADEAKRNHLKVASANWHALATFAGRFAPEACGLLIDIGSTTTDIIPLNHGVPIPEGRTDPERLKSGELLYTGVGRTPVCALLGETVAAELFATTGDAYRVLNERPEDPDDWNTADGRPATRACSFARLARMMCGDMATVARTEIVDLAQKVVMKQLCLVADAVKRVYYGIPTLPEWRVIASGAGELLVRKLFDPPHSMPFPSAGVVSLNHELGPTVSACAPAYAVAVLAAELR